MKLVNLVASIVLFLLLAVNNAIAYSGFTATVISNVTGPLPDPGIFSFTYEGGGLNGNIMMPSTTSATSGTLDASASTDAFYPDPPTPTAYLVQIDISTYDSGDLCTLQYNALTESYQWLVNKTYHPYSGYPAITCQVRMFPGHVFLFISDSTIQAKLLKTN